MNLYIDLLIRISNYLATLDNDTARQFVREIYEALI